MTGFEANWGLKPLKTGYTVNAEHVGHVDTHLHLVCAPSHAPPHTLSPTLSHVGRSALMLRPPCKQQGAGWGGWMTCGQRRWWPWVSNLGWCCNSRFFSVEAGVSRFERCVLLGHRGLLCATNALIQLEFACVACWRVECGKLGGVVKCVFLTEAWLPQPMRCMRIINPAHLRMCT